jgi:REP element-mobilizing transposase RayT
MKQKQFSFLKPNSPSFGGDLQKGKRKTFRPIDPKAPIHLVLKSSRAKGEWSMLHQHHKTKIRDLSEKLAKENGIKIYQFANVGNHLHLLLKTGNRGNFQKFLRVFSGRVAMMITRARKGNPQGRFWDSLAFTRIVQWGRDFSRITRYLFKNQIESFGNTAKLAMDIVRRGMVMGRPRESERLF